MLVVSSREADPQRRIVYRLEKLKRGSPMRA